MNRKTPLIASRPTVLIEALEPRIAPAGLLNETKFTSVVVGSSVLLDASGAPGTYQGLSTAFGSYAGSYLLYLTSGKAIVYTTDLNGNGQLDPGEVTGIALGKDSLGHDPSLLLFTSIHGDIVTNLNSGANNNLTDSDNNPNNGNDGRLLLPTNIASITMRTITASDIDSTVPGNTVANRLGLTDFSIHGSIYAGGNFGGLTIDTSGSGALAAKFVAPINPYLYDGTIPTVDGIFTGTAANYHTFHFTSNSPQVLAGSTTGSLELVNNNVAGTIEPFTPANGAHGGDISNIHTANGSATDTNTTFSIGVLETGNGGAGARGGNITNVTMHGDTGSYEVIAGDGGQGINGGDGGSISQFSDLGTEAGQVFVHSGSGGRGVLGKGGNGGTSVFTTTNIAADYEVVLGSGGAGVTQGGNGAGLTNTLITAPDVTIPIGGKVISTWHDIGDVGNTHPITGGDPTTGLSTYSPEVIDFDGDGFADAVYTSTSPDQVVVVFGNGQGSITDNGGDFFAGGAQKTVVLKVPGGGVPAVTVGDFNGDGKPDIAVASGNQASGAGIYIFLNQIGNSTLDPVNAANYTHNPLGDHPFSSAIESAVPTLVNFGYYGRNNGILALAAGDFNGDGITDIAYAQRERTGGNVEGQIVGVLLGEQATTLTTKGSEVGAHVAGTFANGAIDNGLINNTTGRPEGLGLFYSNSTQTGGASGVQVSPDFYANTGAVVLHATSTASNNVPTAASNGLPLLPEIVVQTIQGGTHVGIYTAFAPNPVTHIPSSAFLDNSNSFEVGYVDTNRFLSAGPVIQVSLQRFIIQDFTIEDQNQDGAADLVFLSSSPQTFLDLFHGGGNGSFAGASDSIAGGGDNNGIFLGAYPFQPSVAISITAADPTAQGVFNGVALLNFNNIPIPHVEVRELQIVATGSIDGFGDGLGDITNSTAVYTPLLNGLYISTVDRAVNALDTYYLTAPSYNKLTNAFIQNGNLQTPSPGYTFLAPDTSQTMFAGFYIIPPGVDGDATYRYLTSNGISLYSGNGGDSSRGAGGNAGNLGDGTLSVGSDATTTASIVLHYTPTLEYSGSGLLRGGTGGNGFTSGGQGGDIQGVVTRYNVSGLNSNGITLTSFRAGDGGNGISGNGGTGGDLSALSVDSGPNFYSGNGGNGQEGGRGGNILGNGLSSVTFDTRNDGVTLQTGRGGTGSTLGGAGGNITGWSSQINGLDGSLLYATGLGGNAANGTGGAGGAITNSPLNSNQDLLAGNLALIAGAGGNGLAGGGGGLISGFANPSTDGTAVPLTLTFLGGTGGIGVTGQGGKGGSVSQISSNALGITAVVDNLYNGLVRIIAGDGGASYGGTGGDGGTINGANVTATSSPLVAAAGQGGTGLTVGGQGGSVLNSVLDSAQVQVGKLLIVAGKGGDALSALKQDIILPNDSDPNDLAHTVLAFGGASPRAGNGGGVANITQPVSVQTGVDIIAGNGGNTPNASDASTAMTGVGQGGSISGIILAGSLGTIQRDNSLGQVANPPIKSYSALDTATGNTTTSVSQFIDFLSSSDSAFFRLDDSVGNVGMVAGASGTVRGELPARDGVNGSVVGVAANSILSIVAGSVDRVAPVSELSGVVVTNPNGVLGADKSVNSPFGPNGVLDYYNTLGVDVANLEPGYRLIDGAIFASHITQTVGQPLIIGPRVKTAEG